MQKFEHAAEKLISYGYDVFNPAILPAGFEYEQFMKDAHIMIDYDIDEEDSFQKKNRLRKMYEAALKMKELCIKCYRLDENLLIEKSA